LSNALFPELPVSGSVRQKVNVVSGNQSLKNILGESTPVGSAWGAAGSAVRAPEEEGEASVNANATEWSHGKAKKKGKQKQTLFTLGTFPT
jgi:hypothetical protein